MSKDPQDALNDLVSDTQACIATIKPLLLAMPADTARSLAAALNLLQVQEPLLVDHPNSLVNPIP